MSLLSSRSRSISATSASRLSSSSVWLQSPKRQAVFVCCGSCSDCPDAELERRIIEQVSEPVAAA
jgi:hypothetical protein